MRITGLYTYISPCISPKYGLQSTFKFFFFFLLIHCYSLQTALNPPISLTNAFPSYLQQFDVSSSLRPSIGSMLPTQLQQLSHAPVSQSTFSILQPGFQTNFSHLPNFLQSQFDLDGMI